mmetsp:Transcript_33437/g.106707  ORF Transcript_33437/g.106707 Transcript_33437/m.106707 type:complete len:520 (+) Transcript_33437:72-1631(+)
MPPSPVLLLALVVSWTGCARVWGLVPAGVLGPVSSTTSTPTTIGGTQPWIDALRVASRTSVSVQENDSVDKEGDDEADEDQTDELQSVRPELPSAPTADSEARGEAEDEDEDSSRADVRPPTFDNHRGPPRRAVKMRASPWQSVLEPDRALHVRTSEAELVSPGPALATATTRQPRVHAEPKDDAFYRKLDFAYDEAFRRLEAGERDDVRGVRVMGGFAEVDPACFRHRKHVDWVLEDDGRWAIYLTKLSLGAHQIMGFTVRNQVTIWELTAGLPDDLPPVVVSSDVAPPQIDVLGAPTKARVDAGIRLRTAPGGWRVVLEIEVKNLNFVQGNTRIYDYMRGCGHWRRTIKSRSARRSTLATSPSRPSLDCRRLCRIRLAVLPLTRQTSSVSTLLFPSPRPTSSTATTTSPSSSTKLRPSKSTSTTSASPSTISKRTGTHPRPEPLPPERQTRTSPHLRRSASGLAVLAFPFLPSCRNSRTTIKVVVCKARFPPPVLSSDSSAAFFSTRPSSEKLGVRR